MTTITIGTSGAAVAAAAGAAGLGLLGLGFLKAKGGRRSGGHKGYGRKQQGYHRRRREVEQELDVEEQEDEEALMEALEVIRQKDLGGCSLMLVCDLAKRNRGELSPKEIAVLDLVG